jgi:hypothetical protein
LQRGLSRGRGEHYTAIVRFKSGYTEIDSLYEKNDYTYYKIGDLIKYLTKKYIIQRMDRNPLEYFQMTPFAIYLN